MLNKIFLNSRSSGIDRSITFKKKKFILMDSRLSGIEQSITFLGVSIRREKKN